MVRPMAIASVGLTVVDSPLVPSLFYFQEQLFLFSRAVIFIFESSYFYFQEQLFLFSGSLRNKLLVAGTALFYVQQRLQAW